MDASIIIITKNQKKFLKQSIPRLLHQSYKGSYEIIVVDSGSTDGAVEYCKEQNIKVVSVNSETLIMQTHLTKGLLLRQANI